MRYTVSLPTT